MGFHEVAKEEGFYACTGWSVDDVRCKAEEHGMELSEADALEFLEDNAKHIVDAMVRAGWDAIDACLEFIDDNEDPEGEDEEAEEFRVNSLPCGPVLAHLGWGRWDTGGGCTAWGYNFLVDGELTDRYLLMTVKGDGCVAPSRMAQAVDVGLYDDERGVEGEECHSFESIYEFIETWDGPYAPPGMMTQELFDQIVGEG